MRSSIPTGLARVGGIDRMDSKPHGSKLISSYIEKGGNNLVCFSLSMSILIENLDSLQVYGPRYIAIALIYEFILIA